MVFVSVRQHDSDDVVESVSNRSEVGKNQVDAGLGFLGEQHSTVDNEQSPVEFVDGHVSADLADSTEGNDSKSTRFERLRFTDDSRHGASFLLRGYAAVGVE